MAETSEILKIQNMLEDLLSSMHQRQVDKAASLARRLRPDLTAEDLLNPDNFSEIINDPNFMYEDGQAAGLLSAKIAVRAALKNAGDE